MTINFAENQIDWSKYKREYLVENIKEDYIFFQQITKIEKLILTNTSKNDSEKYGCIKNNDKFNRLIGVAGERGSGKSSLITTLRHSLKKQQKFENYYVLPIIDPNKLDNHLGILETILSNLYLEVEKKRNELCNPSNDFNEVSRKIVSQLGIVSKLSISKSDLKKGYSNEEILQQYHKQLLFEDDFHELFGDVWSVLKGMPREKYKRGYLVILIDDIDLMGNSLVYSMLEDIKKVLSYNVTTIVTYRYTQLLNSIYDSKIKENINLFNQKIIDVNEIQLQTSTYIEKMFHQNQIVKMPLKEEIINLPLKGLFSTEESNYLIQKKFVLNNSIIKNIYDAFKIRTLIDLHSIDINERTLYESGFTLRGVVQILEFLYDTLEIIDFNFSGESLVRNLKKVKNYFSGVADQLLNYNEKEILEKWDLVDAQSKNYIIYKELYQLLFKTEQNKLEIKNNMEYSIRNLLAINKVEPYNVSLGDVVEIINVFKDNIGYELTKYHFVYTLKIFYSIELLISLSTEIYKIENGNYILQFKLQNKDSNLYFEDIEDTKINAYWSTKYYQLTRYKIIPDSITWFSRNTNKLNLLYTGVSKDLTDIESHFLKEINEENLINEQLKENLSKEERIEFFDKILYTPVAVSGDMQISRLKNINLISSSNAYAKDPHRFRYRHYFLFRFNNLSKLHESDETKVDEITSVKEGIRYPFDPYSYLVKENYLDKAINKYGYLFYSMFDIDIISTKNHDNKKNKPYSDLLKSVNKIVRIVLSNKYNLAEKLKNVESNSKDDLFSESEIDFLVNLKEKDERILSDLEMIILGYKGQLDGYSVERKNNLIKYAIEELDLGSYVSRRYRKELEIFIKMQDKTTSKLNKEEIKAANEIIEYLQSKLDRFRYSSNSFSED